MSQTADTRAFIEDYFDALNEKRIDRIPIAEQCTYNGSMLSEPIHGADAVREHIAAIIPFIDRFEIRRLVAEGASGAVVVRLRGFGDKTIDGAVFFDVDNGELAAFENLLDTRLLFND